MDLLRIEGELALCRLGPGDPVPKWAGGGFLATVRTPEGLSVVCSAEGVPAGVRCERPWRALRVAGKLDLTLTGVLIALLEPLEAAAIPIFAISSFDTDYVLVPGERLADAVDALEIAGHRVA